MAKFLVTYYEEGGGGMPPDPAMREQMMKAFMAWANRVGDKMVDPGAPLGPPKVLTGDSVSDDKPGDGVGGYTLLSAGSMDEAVGLCRDHPFLDRGGTLRVSEALAP
jgi:hypothetical protein